MQSFRVALCQFKVGLDKRLNLATAADFITQAAQNHAQVVVLPECFNSPYGTQHFAEYAEDLDDSETDRHLKQIAKDHGILLIGGSIPEREGTSFYNTCLVYDSSGSVIGRHRKVHLFDIDIPGKITFRESDVLSPGNSTTVVETPFCKVGLGICYDLRFPDYAKSICKDEAVGVLAYPGCFNTVTGPKHWELLLRSRAVDNQVFVLACSQALDPNSGYKAYGHSMVVSPWGEVLASAAFDEQLVLADLDFTQLAEYRQAIPVRKQSRPEVYH